MEPVLVLSASSVPLTGALDGERIHQGDKLIPAQKQELKELEDQFEEMFSVEPRQTHILQHDIKTSPGVAICQWPYWVPEAHR